MSIVSKIMETVVKHAPDPKLDELSEARRLIGKPIDRVDGKQKVTGTATFTAEFSREQLTHAALVYSTIPSGTITHLDTQAAEDAPGVVKVITNKNAPRMNTPPLFDPSGGTDAAGSSVNVLNTDTVYWNGQPIALVVADTLDHAEQAAALVKVTYRELPAQTSFEEGKTTAYLPEKVLGEEPEIKEGDAEAALAQAAYKVDNTYTTPQHNHNAIELHATMAYWEDGKLTVYDASQGVRAFADTLAKIFSLDKNDVRVLAPFVGGGFGGKGTMWSHVQLCVLAAKVVERPVRLVLSREGVFRVAGGRTPSEQRVALGTDEASKLSALIHTGITAMSTNNDFPEQFSFPARHLYQAETLLIRQEVMQLNMTANSFMRAPGESIGTFALESALDELSYQVGMDPIALRLLNEPERDPTKDTPFSSRHVREAYAMGREKFGWDNRPSAPRSQQDGDWLVGQGVATAYYPAYRFPMGARVRLNQNGTLVVQTSVQEMGMGTATAQGQHAAERFGLNMEDVRLEYGDTNFPVGAMAGGSSQTISTIAAVHEAFNLVRKELLAVAKKDKDSPLAKADPDDVQAINGGLYLRSDPSVGENYGALLLRAEKEYIEVEAQSKPPMEMMKYSMHSYGAQFCEVRVHVLTGEVHIARWVGVFDTGRILNAKTARSQFRGGIIMGIGAALTEQTNVDPRNGRIANPSLAEYHVPVNADIPHIEVHYLDIPDPYTPLGAHGIGEIGITGAAAAVANAVYHATGKRIRDLPITLDKLM